MDAFISTIKDVIMDILQIDKVNQCCYDLLAKEYDDKCHRTCRDFEFIISKNLHVAFDKLDQACKHPLKDIIDIGTGTGNGIGYLLQNYPDNDFNIDILDISKNMLDITQQKYKDAIRSAHNRSIFDFISKTTKQYDLALSFLGDPYGNDYFIHNIKRIIKKDGFLLLCLPNYDWAVWTRKDNDKLNITYFKTADNKTLQSFSFVQNTDLLIDKYTHNGFKLLCDKSYSIHIDESKSTNIKSYLENNMNAPIIDIILLQRGQDD